MNAKSYFKIPGIPRPIEIIIIASLIVIPFLYVMIGTWDVMRLRTVSFRDVQEMQERLGMDFRGTYNHFGYMQFTKGKGPTVYGIMCALEDKDLECFTKNNGLEGKLICDDRSLLFAEIVKSIDPRTKKRCMRDWIPVSFVPKYGFSDKGLTMLVGTCTNKTYLFMEKIK